MTSFPAEVYIV